MKYLFCTLAFLCMAVAAGAQTIDGFWGITWGTNEQVARKAMMTHPGVRELAEAEKEDLVFDGGKFAGQPVYLYVLIFTNHQFSSGTVVFDTDKSTPADDLAKMYADMKAELSAKYKITPTPRTKDDEILGSDWDTTNERISLYINKKDYRLTLHYLTIQFAQDEKKAGGDL